MKRNRLHSICPYFAMFPEQFVRKHVVSLTEPGDVVFDPFSGRGTTVLESLLLNRNAFGTDSNPVAVCLSNAKANPPSESDVLKRLLELEGMTQLDVSNLEEDEFFSLCFHSDTLRQIAGLRSSLSWRTDQVDCFIAATALGCLHGESHKTANCFSNRMPRTISTKKAYSVSWWKNKGLLPPHRDVFSILRNMVSYRLATDLPSVRGIVAETDARQAGDRFAANADTVRLVVTSPPYLDMTDYSEDQWLRLWFLGGESAPTRGFADDRHRSIDSYWNFLRETWLGLQPLLACEAILVVRIGGTRVSFSDAQNKLSASLNAVFGDGVTALDDGYCSEIVGRQTNVFRPGTSGKRFEFDFRYRITS